MNMLDKSCFQNGIRRRAVFAGEGARATRVWERRSSPAYLKACSAISTVTFRREEFIKEYNLRKSSGNDMPADEALALLYRFSVIGYERRSGYGGSSWGLPSTTTQAAG